MIRHQRSGEGVISLDGILADEVAAVTAQISMPFTAQGGIVNPEDASYLCINDFILVIKIHSILQRRSRANIYLGQA
ncbi:hypothetical protein SDC9_164057 [bioreactor metagenome]|uniref:Uncharacterized protein n=1 Tax=bioreactor metagenome TaxID=1076179 RepID=A0A645FSV5_9ZZZZ